METKGKEQIQEEIAEEIEDIPDDKINEEEAVDEIEELLSEDNDETIEEEEETEETKVKPSKKKKDEDEDEDIVDERIYTIPLGKALVRPPKKRAPRAITLIREFIIRHMKMDTSAFLEEEKGELPKLTITNAVNEKVWSRSIKKPPRKIRVRVTKDKEDNIKVFLAEGE